MNVGKWVRTGHRWVSMVFTLAVAGNMIAMATSGGKMPPPWITYAPLPPLFLLMFSGWYLLVQPWLAGKRAAREGQT